ncbi:uncharacterized protein BDZ99DRAFT_523279 [Mytilinidion resinicola]|uniref:Uncharacterized protein n=1 Tax=Mytilinidion resinicola TaxID=574789 RepID=A0A6A6YF69_9PEZI|nr:uncharacterized protein BDZ99DRAFT_523279 [Mytilinidion resinicola]KAF2806705.1 hypothetical protein BDZ99DRAFT_523279 [Mytilinidion resinicola]
MARGWWCSPSGEQEAFRPWPWSISAVCLTARYRAAEQRHEHLGGRKGGELFSATPHRRSPSPSAAHSPIESPQLLLFCTLRARRVQRVGSLRRRPSLAAVVIFEALPPSVPLGLSLQAAATQTTTRLIRRIISSSCPLLDKTTPPPALQFAPFPQSASSSGLVTASPVLFSCCRLNLLYFELAFLSRARPRLWLRLAPPSYILDPPALGRSASSALIAACPPESLITARLPTRFVHLHLLPHHRPAHEELIRGRLRILPFADPDSVQSPTVGHPITFALLTFGHFSGKAVF